MSSAASCMKLMYLPSIGVVVALVVVWSATLFFPGGYNWNKDFISSLFHAGSETSRWIAIAGVFTFWGSLALIFERLVRSEAFKPDASWLRMTGHGSCVYGCFIVTPMHDLMINISVAFMTGTLILLLRRLTILKSYGLLAGGVASAVLLLISAALYYGGQLDGPLLPWMQRISFLVFAAWLVALDLTQVPSAKLNKLGPT